jgi:hypothetical protein
MSRSANKKTLSRPLIIALFLALAIPVQGAIGWWAFKTLRQSTMTDVAEDLQTILDADVAALEIWLEHEELSAEASANHPVVREQARRLVELASERDITPAALLASPAQAELREYLQFILSATDHPGFAIIDRTGRILAARNEEMVGEFLDQDAVRLSRLVEAGTAGVTLPFTVDVPIPDRDGVMRSGQPIMFAAAPIRDDGGDIIASFGFRIDPQDDFTRILRTARYGESGETYAFDATGLLISESRFNDELRAIGLIGADPSSRSILNVQIRDPGTYILDSNIPRDQQPLTRMATAATQGEVGVDVDGYRDYRGVEVVGAWTWLDDYEFGVTTEVDAAEAFASLTALNRAFLVLILALAISALGILASYLIIRSLRKTADRARKLGQYTLEKKIGEGGMGAVYRARHALLRRPTAVKLLPEEASSEEAVTRFEREVQMTSELTHPNTIEIYDYGRTPEGIFYYAMEYLPGYSLNQLVELYGPLPEGRVIHILDQACSSLAEAHGAGIIHRDVKPSNIMVCERGGIHDVVKVLDFGLVKEVDQASDLSITAVGSVTGTPLYVSPEGIKSPDDADGRSDLYCLAAVGYYLLTGGHVFQGESPLEVFSHHLTSTPEPPSTRVEHEIAKDLEELMLRCLEKDRDQRPNDAHVLRDELAKCEDAGSWGEKEAIRWWEEHPWQEGVVRRADGISTDSKLQPTMAVAFQDRVKTAG